MGSKSYDQYCGIAKALDLVGERWTLLVVRELLDGPKRYTDLQSGVPGIATDMLAARLKSLEEAELVARRLLPPPAASTVYELTEAGLSLEPVLRELGRFGLQFLGKRRGESFRVHWLSLPLQTMFRPDRATGEPLVVQFDSGGESMHAIIDEGTLSTASGPADEPHVVIAGDMAVLALAARDRQAGDDAVEKGRMQVTGRKQDIRRVLEVFGLKK